MLTAVHTGVAPRPLRTGLLLAALCLGVSLALVAAMMFFVPSRQQLAPASGPHRLEASYNPKLVFVIGRGQSLADYVGYDTAIDVAQRFQLEVRDGGKRITYAQARDRNVDRLAVDVVVQPGDRFDLNGPASGWTFAPQSATSAPQR